MRVSRKSFFLMLVVLGCMVPHAADALRPLVTDDVEIIESYHFLMELGGQYQDFGPDGVRHIYDWTLGRTFFEDYEFSIHLPYEGHIVYGRKTWGFGELETDLKWKWLKEARSVPAVGVKLGLKLDTGQENDSPPIGTGSTDVKIDLLLQKSVPWLTLYGNVGYTARTGSRVHDRVRASMAGRHPLSDKTDIFTELVGSTSTQPAEKDDIFEWYIGVGHQTRWDWRWDLGGTLGFTRRAPDWSIRFGTASEF